MNAPVEPPRLSDCGPLWQRMIDGLADMQADLLRRVHGQMEEGRERDEFEAADMGHGARDE
ncbi:hypothetical protein [Mesorhizobium sp. Z1-4]|uniref:hypothetical protein n=1 Tax=Mesorhizobium sp. Z1-4 TaxID=2448478 RepID=UPI000FDAAF07|nr:hypothetical protein [Mesorhizobium sp. Z1-4]